MDPVVLAALLMDPLIALSTEPAVALPMDLDYSPCPDYDSALKWLEERGSFVKDSWIVKTFTPQEVARRVLVQRIKDSKIVCVRGFDNNLPDSDIHKAMTNHFSSCGEIVRVLLCPTWEPKSHPDRFVRLNIIGEDVKDKAEQLNGSDLGGCKLAVFFPPPSRVSAADLPRMRILHRRRRKLSEHERGLLDLNAESRKALHEKERKPQLVLDEEARLEEERKQPAQNKMETEKISLKRKEMSVL